LLAVIAGLFGLMVGSFLNVVIFRLPVMLNRDWRAQCQEMLAGKTDKKSAPATAHQQESFNLVTPRSRCPGCGAPIKAHQNIPIVSYVLLKGRCAACGAGISIRYPLVEALTAALSALVAWHFGFTLECAGALALTWSLIALSGIDLDEQLLPDLITLPLLWLGLGFNLLGQSADSPLFVGPEAAILGAILGYLSLWSVYWGFRLTTGKEGMGYGDFKLLAALGAWMGWQMLLLIITLSAIVGLVFAVGMMLFRGHKRQIPIPFGPYLAIAGFVALLWGQEIISAYKSISGL
jgi:leader peptidase (prepilin peptidase)/N-methyltransferase